MENKINSGLTLRDLWKLSGAKLEVNHFVSEPGPCENRNFFIPVPRVPENKLEPEVEEKAKALLDKCTSIVGTWGENRSSRDNSEYIESANAFKELTGIDVWDIISEARRRFMEPTTSSEPSSPLDLLEDN